MIVEALIAQAGGEKRAARESTAGLAFFLPPTLHFPCSTHRRREFMSRKLQVRS